MRPILILLAVFFLCSDLHAQSGWTQAQGEGYFKLSQSVIRAGRFFNPDGDLIDITTTSIYTTSLYGEYGITDRLTAILSAPVFVRSTINNRESSADGFVIPGDEFNDQGDIAFGGRYGLIHQGPVVLSASALLKLPSGENVGGESELLQSGDGAWGLIAMLHASHSFYPAPFYATLSAGYQWRGNATLDYSSGPLDINYDDAFRAGGELGWTPGDHWQFALKMDLVLALRNGSSGGVTGSSSIFGNRITYLSLIPEVNYIIGSRFGLSVSVGTVMLAQNILGAPSFNGGFFYLLK